MEQCCGILEDCGERERTAGGPSMSRPRTWASTCVPCDTTLTVIRGGSVHRTQGSRAQRRHPTESNEWKKARHFGEQFWLSLAIGARTDEPQLRRIYDPAIQFRTGEDSVAAGFIVDERWWRERETQDSGVR